jgi:uncharacterized protein
MLRLARILLIFVAASLAMGMPQAWSEIPVAEGQPMILPISPDALVVETETGEQRFTIEVADTDLKRSAGLMFRTSMGDMHGMLFVFEQTRRVSFWMKNTPMPLDLIFIGEDGRVAAVLPGEPFSVTSIGPDVPVRFVLELKRGTAQKTGIADGVRLRHPLIDRIAGAG